MNRTADLATHRADRRLCALASCIADCFDLIASALHDAAGLIRGFSQETV